MQNIFVQSHSHHRYIIEPQSLQYLAHGDLWDHLYLQACAQAQRVFLPLTLEDGLLDLGEEEPAAAFLASRHLQPAD